jgi:hypothetical protein
MLVGYKRLTRGTRTGSAAEQRSSHWQVDVMYGAEAALQRATSCFFSSFTNPEMMFG